MPNDGPSACMFSEDRVYRYRLEHIFDTSKLGCEPAGQGIAGSVNFVMLNPSTADEKQLDPTLRRCKGFARQWGFGSFVVTNLFAFRATSPLDMKRALDPVGPENDRQILIEAYRAELVVVGWGSHGHFIQRDVRVLSLLKDYAKRVCYLGLTGSGLPRHPLFVASNTELQDWK